MSNFIIYHNPRCSKSRQTLALLVKEGYEPKVFLYLEEELSHNMLEEVLLKLNIEPRDLLRKGEEEYKKKNLSNNALSNKELIKFNKLLKDMLLGKPLAQVLGYQDFYKN